MGAFHEGHVSLMKAGRLESDTVVVSLFVNPTQFGPNEDFSKYPRDEERDARMAEEAAVDVLFAPSVKDVSDRWDGEHRPGHFDGVATVVLKLFNIVEPDVAFFGLKDLQQCAVIRRMVEDLDCPVKLNFCSTVREEDGLALSSRNAYLSPKEREIAPLLYKELTRAADVLRNQHSSPRDALDKARQRLSEAGFSVEYFDVVDTNTMAPKDAASIGDSIIAAVRLGRTRLIDNTQID
jgi:pantoate--beta-alanine ligase